MKKTQRSIDHPIYWPAWCLIAIFWTFIQIFPYRILLKIGKFFGLLMLKLDKRQRHTTEINLTLCFPELTKQDRAKLLRENFISLGIGIIESALAWWASDRKLHDLAHFHHAERFHKAQADGQGVILLGIHFTNVELAGRLFALHGFNFSIIYREQKSRFLEYLHMKFRSKYYPGEIERRDVRKILKTLKKGQTIWYTPDIDAGYYDYIFAPFFGIPAASLTATARLPKISGAHTMLSYSLRRDNGTGYDMYFSEIFENFPSEDLHKDITRVNKLIEEAIRKKPEQYLWQYKRFKTRPPGESRFYGSKE